MFGVLLISSRLICSKENAVVDKHWSGQATGSSLSANGLKKCLAQLLAMPFLSFEVV